MSWMSRSVYFCVVSSLVLILDAVLATRPDDWSQTRLYGISLFSRPVVVYVKDALAGKRASRSRNVQFFDRLSSLLAFSSRRLYAGPSPNCKHLHYLSSRTTEHAHVWWKW